MPPDAIQGIVDTAYGAASARSNNFEAVYADIVQLQQKDGSNTALFKKDMADLDSRLHAKGILNDLQITGVDDAHHLLATKDGKNVAVLASNTTDIFQQTAAHESFWDSTKDVLSNIGTGALDEIEHHPGRVLLSGAVGFGIGVAATFTAPALVIGTAVIGAGIATYEVAKNAPGWIHDASLAAHPGLYSQTEQKQADQGLQHFGAGAVDVAAGVVGSVAGGFAGSALKAAFVPKGDPIPEPNPEEIPENSNDPENTNKQVHTQHHNVANVTGQLARSGDPTQGAGATNVSDPTQGHVASFKVGDPTQGHAPGLTVGDPTQGHAAALTVGSQIDNTPPADVPLTQSPTFDATPPSTSDASPPPDAPPPPVAANAELTLDQSIAQNQALFRAAATDDGDGVITAVKQSYNVQFRRLTSPELVPTLENPAGQAAEPGQWVATRLNPDGTPNIENGMVNQWPVTEKAMLKTYQITHDQLPGADNLTAATRTDAPPVHMVKLTSDIKFKTSWGDLTGKAGDYLSNYDFSIATGQPGNDFAIVTASSYAQTYQAVQVGM